MSGLEPLSESGVMAFGARWRSSQYAVQPSRVEEITTALEVVPTVDAFSEGGTARFPRWWGPGSPETTDAFSRPWTSEVLWVNPPFASYPKILEKIVEDRAHAVLIMPEWHKQDFFHKAKNLEIRSVRFDCHQGLFEVRGKPLPLLRWPVQAIFVCGDRAGCPVHGTCTEGEEDPAPDIKNAQNLSKPWRRSAICDCMRVHG